MRHQSGTLFQDRGAALLLLPILLAGTVLRAVHLGSHRFHVDEALFSAYGLAIASGSDPFLAAEAVDKPPLFFYLLGLSFRFFGSSEAAAAVPSLFASIGSIVLVFHLARRFYGPPTALLAALLMAVSPFNVAYAYTAFIDSSMVFLALLGTALALRRWFFSAGIVLGLLFAIKAQGVLFWPAVGLFGIIGLLWEQEPRRRWFLAAARVATGLALPVLALNWWTAQRLEQPPYLDLAAAHNPLVVADAATYGPKLLEWWQSSLQFMAASTPLNVVLLLGAPLLVAGSLVALFRQRGKAGPAVLADLTLGAYFVFFMGWHTYFETPAWDRYMLGIVPFGLLLLARALALAWRLLRPIVPAVASARAFSNLGLAAALFLAVSLASPVNAGLQSTYFLGWSGSGGPTTYEGIHDMVAYLKANHEEGAILYDYQSLSWHYKYYLFGVPYRIVWFDDSLLWSFQHSVIDNAGTAQFLVLPEWMDGEEVRAELGGELARLTEVHRSYRDVGSVSFTVYRVEKATPVETQRPDQGADKEDTGGTRTCCRGARWLQQARPAKTLQPAFRLVVDVLMGADEENQADTLGRLEEV